VLPQEATPPADLRGKIMARVAALLPRPVITPKPQPALAQPAPERFHFLRSLAPIAIAASVLLCITVVSFAYFSNQDSGNQSTANNPWANVLPAPQDPPTAVPSPNATPREPHHADADTVARHGMLPVPQSPMPKVVTPDEVAIAPEPRSVSRDFIGSRILDPLEPFEIIQVRLPFLRAVAELDREDVRNELIDELDRDMPYRLDLFVRDTARGVDVFQNAAKATGLTVFSDAATLDKLKKKQAHSVVIYTESLTPAELAALFARLTAEDMKFTPRVCDSLHVMPVVRSDESELKLILGMDPGLYKRTRAKPTAPSGEKNTGEPKSVSAGTIDMVSKSLTTPPAKPGPKYAMLLTWQTTHANIARTNPASSAELKQFRDKRGERKPDAVPAIIIIRPVG
jgi:hypothetical protein